MEIPTTLYLLCGKMAAGKSTLSTDLSRNLRVVVLSEDELLARLFPGEITDIPSYSKMSERLKSAIGDVVVDLLSNGVSLILDFPANTASQRAWLRGLADQAKVNHELHYIDVSDSICKTQLLKRAIEHPERASTDTIEMFDAISKYFEPPSEEEGLNIMLVERIKHT